MTKNLRTLTLTAALIWAAGTAFAQQMDGLTVLRNMLHAESNASYTAHQVTVLSRAASEQDVVRNGYKGMRVEYTAPPSLRGEIMVDDGTSIRHLVPGQRLLVQRASRLAGLRALTAQLGRTLRQGNLQVDLLGRDTVAGRPTYIIEVRPGLRRPAPIRRFWVDSDKWVKLKTVEIARNGTETSTSYYTKIDFPRRLPHGAFMLDVPSDFRAVDRPRLGGLLKLVEIRGQVDFQVRKPSYLPAGFKLLGGRVIPFRRGEMVALRYTDGVASFSLFQARASSIRGIPRPNTSLYTWRQGEMVFTLVGSIPPEAVRRVADSVR
jgi:negative regulator of sigma E activity